MGSMKSPNGNVIELCRDESGAYFTRLYLPEPDSDRPLTRDQATDLLQIMAGTGGLVRTECMPPRAAS
jgi:hypothetical protein